MTETTPTTYAAAVRELEAILDELEDDAVDIDLLADKVRRAAELIRFCRSRIDAARVEVTAVVADLDAGLDAGPNPGHDAGEDPDETNGPTAEAAAPSGDADSS